jgi:polysaccharide pyruvyl transferase WcaK-like protein
MVSAREVAPARGRTADASGTDDVKIAFISPCGFGNLGDAAIQDAFLDNVRERLGGDVEFLGITQNPPDTVMRHHVRAAPMDIEAFRACAKKTEPAVGSDVGGDSTGGRRRMPGIVRGAKRVAKEVLHWRLALREMRGTTALFVSGGGQLDDHWGGAWRAPYALWKWTLAARLRGARIVVLSVGAGTTDSMLTQFFLRTTLSRASYASFRDSRTAAQVDALRLSSSTIVVPDLAFSYDGSAPTPRPLASAERPTVALSPIAFLDPASWPAKDRRAYAAYVEQVVTLGRRLLEGGWNVILCTSDSPDIKTADEVYARVLSHSESRLEGRLVRADTPHLGAFLESLRVADVVIASRLHGVILAHLVGTPTIALSYDWKVDEHMRVMELERYRFPIGSFDANAVTRTAEAMLAEKEALSEAIAARCNAFAVEVLQQYDVALDAAGISSLNATAAVSSSGTED